QLQSTANTAPVAAGDITVTATRRAANGMEARTSSPLNLSGADQEYIPSSTDAARKTFDVTYAPKGFNKYRKPLNTNQKPTVYTSQVVYRILPNSSTIENSCF